MKLRTISLIGTLSLLGVALAYIVQSAFTRSPTAVPQAQVPHNHLHDHHDHDHNGDHHGAPEPPQRATPAEFQRELAAAQAHRKALEDKFNAITSQAAAKRTVEGDLQMVNFIMKEREPRYRGLFNLWKMDIQTSQSLLHTIREREIRRKEWEYQRRKAGVDGLNWTFSDPVSEEALAKVLNDVQQRQFSALEKMILKENLASAQKLTQRD